MIAIYLYAFGSVFIVSLISLVGVSVLSLREEFLRKYIYIFISLATGALLGDAFIHLIPESLENSPDPAFTSTLIIIGIIAFFILEKFFHWHHHGEDANEPHQVYPIGKLILFSDGIHNITDGIVIGASYLISFPVGVATTLAVILHEIPQEIGDFAVLVHAGYPVKKALWFNFLSALTALIGVVIVLFLGSLGDSFNAWMLAVVAGGFIYIAIADLIPELHKTKELKHSLIQIAVVIVGVLAMLVMTFLE